MLNDNMKDLLIEGAFLQVDTDLFTVFKGPFIRVSDLGSIELTDHSYLIRTNYWSFLTETEDFAQNIVYLPQFCQNLTREKFIELLTPCAQDLPHINWKNPTFTDFQEQFDWSQKQFSSGQLEKTVPIILQEADCKILGPHRARMILNLLKNRDFGWSYGSWSAEQGYLGYTPEVLCQWKPDLSDWAHTVALAGTYPRQIDAEVQILKDQKIRREHQIVIEDIQNKLRPFRLQTSLTEPLTLKHLVHLKTDLHFQVETINDVFQVIKNLHPTAAMGLYPNNKTKLKELAGFKLQSDRQNFAAPFGLISRNMAHIVVAIRQLQFNSDAIRIYSGCGVTQDSDLNMELKELENKRNSVKKMLGLMND